MIIPRARPLRTHTGILTYADRSTPSDKKNSSSENLLIRSPEKVLDTQFENTHVSFFLNSEIFSYSVRSSNPASPSRHSIDDGEEMEGSTAPQLQILEA